jgi:putative endonuclease
MWVVYILLCQDGTLYTGCTNNLEKRFLAHQKGLGGSYTRSHKVVKIIYKEQLNSKSEALKREIEIKSWSRQAKIRSLKLELN